MRRQNAVWERALQTRIVLQRTVNSSAKLPTPSYAAALKDKDNDVAPAMAHFAGAARGALSALLQLQAALIDGNPAIAAAAHAVANGGGGGEGEEDEGGGAGASDGAKKRKKSSAAAAAVSGMELLGSPADKVWAAVDSMYGRYSAFRDVSCDRWHRKAQVSVGKMAAGGGGGGGGGGVGQMQAFNQSISAQVSAAMRLPDRLVQRSQPPAHLAPRRLGEPPLSTGGEGGTGVGGDKTIANGGGARLITPVLLFDGALRCDEYVFLTNTGGER